MRIKNVERKIANIEGFEVTIRYVDGRDVRGDKEGLPRYEYQKAAKHDFTVAQWRDQRFSQAYAGYQVSVWNADGSEAHGKTKLATVRDTYLNDT